MIIVPPENRENAYADLLTGTMIVVLGLSVLALAGVSIFYHWPFGTKADFQKITFFSNALLLLVPGGALIIRYGFKLMTPHVHWLHHRKRNP